MACSTGTMGFMVPCALVRINFEITRSILMCNYILMGSASSIDLDVIIYSSVIISYEMEFCLQCTKRSLTEGCHVPLCWSPRVA